jgi:hypothetical protein
MLPMETGETFAILKEVFLALILGQQQLKLRVFITSITNELILGLDIMSTYNGSVDLGCQMLNLAEENLLLWSSLVGPRPFILVVASDQMVPAQCKVVVMA